MRIAPAKQLFSSLSCHLFTCNVHRSGGLIFKTLAVSTRHQPTDRGWPELGPLSKSSVLSVKWSLWIINLIRPWRLCSVFCFPEMPQVRIICRMHYFIGHRTKHFLHWDHRVMLLFCPFILSNNYYGKFALFLFLLSVAAPSFFIVIFWLPFLAKKPWYLFNWSLFALLPACRESGCFFVCIFFTFCGFNDFFSKRIVSLMA